MPKRPVDWLVCDIVWQPATIASLVARWIGDGRARHAIFNLKLPMKKRYDEVRRCEALIRDALDEGAREAHAAAAPALPRPAGSHRIRRAKQEGLPAPDSRANPVPTGPCAFAFPTRRRSGLRRVVVLFGCGRARQRRQIVDQEPCHVPTVDQPVAVAAGAAGDARNVRDALDRWQESRQQGTVDENTSRPARHAGRTRREPCSDPSRSSGSASTCPLSTSADDPCRSCSTSPPKRIPRTPLQPRLLTSFIVVFMISSVLAAPRTVSRSSDVVGNLTCVLYAPRPKDRPPARNPLHGLHRA